MHTIIPHVFLRLYRSLTVVTFTSIQGLRLGFMDFEDYGFSFSYIVRLCLHQWGNGDLNLEDVSKLRRGISLDQNQVLVGKKNVSCS